MAPITREEFATPAGRRRAWRELILRDHGVIRSLYDNSHELSPGKAWRSFQPGPKSLARWKERGVRTVVNLRGSKPSSFLFLEEEACADLGLNFETFRVYSREAPSLEIILGARELLNRIEYPALFHCKSGADRAGVFSVLYLFLHEGLPLDEAVKQLSLRYGHVRQGKTGVIDYAFDLYFAYARENDVSLNDQDAFINWATNHYDHVQVKADFKAAWWGALLTEKILRRE